MQTMLTDKFLGKLLAFGTFLTTILVVSGVVTDPVNTPKFVAIGVVGCASIVVFFSSKLRSIFLRNRILLFAVLVFIVSLLISSCFSKSPTSQILYGVYGRNNGLLAYIFLVMLLITASSLRSIDSFRAIVNALMLAGFINVVYCLWVLVFGDFIGWNNPYGNILGTFGNPNFIGAFLGIFFSVTVAKILDRSISKSVRFCYLAILPICAIEIVASSAIQGRVVAAFGTSYVIFLYVRSKFSKFIQFAYLSVCGTLGSLAVAGALQIGPLTSFIYKNSVSLRGQYWLAAWNTAKSHPFSGVGMDGFGDWYRRMRDPHALELPGINTVVNAAHNVPLDILAFGGWPLLLGYIAMFSCSGISIVRIIRRKREFNSLFTILSSAWFGYQLQSIISINQIGLAVWGWVLSGFLIAYEKATSEPHISNDSGLTKRLKTKPLANPAVPAQIPVIATLGAVLGLILALPPLTADAKWRSSQMDQKLTSLEDTMKASYFNPPNTMKFQLNVQTLEQSDLFELSRKYALAAVDWNPDNFDSWKVLYYIKNSTQKEKSEALANMKRLDPLNPELKSLK